MSKTRDNLKGCCRDFKAAQASGTDNEGYGRLLRDWNGEWEIGSGLASIAFCPWCGKAVEGLNESHQD